MKVEQKEAKNLMYMKTDFKDILIGEEAKNPIKEGINDLAKAVLITMGPEGKTVIIPDENGYPKITKDGVSVAKAVSFKDPIKNIGALLIKEVAKKTVQEAGDGTTTSICLANSFINKGTELLNNGYSQNNIKDLLNSLEEEVTKRLFNNVTEVNGEDIKNVATIAANNNEYIGKVIKNAFDFSKVVKVEKGYLKSHSVELIDGVELNTGILDYAFINDPSSQAISYKKGRLLIVGGKLDNLNPYINIIESLPNNTPLVIIASEISDKVRKILVDNYNKGALMVGLIKSPGHAQHRENLLEDLKIASGAINGFGWFNSIKATPKKTFISFEPNKESEKRVKDLKKLIKSTYEDYSKELLQQRINLFEGKIAVIKVGGNSEVEIMEAYDRIEDAVLATKCAIEKGVVDGAGYFLKNIADEIGKSNLFSECLKSPELQIRKNGWKGLNKKVPYEEGIIDPLKVVYTSFYNAISVAKTVLGIEAIVQ